MPVVYGGKFWTLAFHLKHFLNESDWAVSLLNICGKCSLEKKYVSDRWMRAALVIFYGNEDINKDWTFFFLCQGLVQDLVIK